MTTRNKSAILADALIALETAKADPELRAEVEALHIEELGFESAMKGEAPGEDLPVFMVTLARDVTAIPPSGGEANHLTQTMPAVVVVRPDDPQQVIKGVFKGAKAEDLLPKDQGLRVYGNWKIVSVEEHCEAGAFSIPVPEDVKEGS